MTEVQEVYGGPHCALCGYGADELIIVTSQCEKNGLGKFVCLGCCGNCDLRDGCVLFFEFKTALIKDEK